MELEKGLKQREAQLTSAKGEQLLKEEVDEEDIAEVVARWTRIPVSRLLEGEIEKLLRMEDRLRDRVVGQEEAIRAVANAVRRARAGLQDPNRPLGSFIFLGPTGVGKTELARALAEFLFDDERSMIRLDMSEYMEKHTVSRLIGAPPGYVGYDEGGQLTEAVRRRPYAVVLLDEIEKAHQDVFNVLLQMLDDGRLTDGHGRTVDFKNTVLIMTSNLGSQWLVGAAAGQEEEIRQHVMEELRARFRPEFLNRVDETIIFHQLGEGEIRKIVDLQFTSLKRRLAERHIDVVLSDSARDILVREGFDPAYGARPLKRTIQRLVLDPLAVKVLEGAFRDGDTISVDGSDGALDVRRIPQGGNGRGRFGSAATRRPQTRTRQSLTEGSDMTTSSSERDSLCINTLRTLAIDAVQAARSGHPGAPLGAAAMAYVLWERFLRHNPHNPGWPDRDRFVLSAGPRGRTPVRVAVHDRLRHQPGGCSRVSASGTAGRQGIPSMD